MLQERLPAGATADDIEVTAGRAGYELRAIVSYRSDVCLIAPPEHAQSDIVEGTVVLDVPSGSALDGDEEKYILANATMFLASLQSGRRGTVLMCDDTLPAKALERIGEQNIKMLPEPPETPAGIVMVPSPRRLVLTIALAPVTILETIVHIENRSFTARWLSLPDPTAQPLLVAHDLPERLSIFPDCGHLDVDSRTCPVCVRSLCPHCSVPVRGDYCSEDCYEEARHRALWPQVTHEDVRALLNARGERIQCHVAGDMLALTITGETAYLWDTDMVEISRHELRDVRVEAGGLWPRRHWKLVADCPEQTMLAVFPARENAESFAAVLAEWLSG